MQKKKKRKGKDFVIILLNENTNLNRTKDLKAELFAKTYDKLISIF